MDVTKFSLQGLYHVALKPVYWKPLGIFAGSYLLVFGVVAGAYYVTIMPFILAGALLTMGPVGLFVAHIQWLVQSNTMASYICRNLLVDKLNVEVFDVTLVKKGQQKLVTEAKYLDKKSTKRSKFNWSIHSVIYSFVTARVYSLTKTLMLSAISLIPIFGPLIVNQITAPDRALSYLSRYFRMRHFTSAETKAFKYRHLGPLACFGVAAGLLELIPFTSMITIMSNTVGAALWANDLMKKEQIDTVKTQL
ncbi:hypothetical protein RNJ44_03263 [Nakaseomyces bracarensis]|uniref:Outer spore wall protein RRT8 n=1 Tax=Nakaseomyces bracarensis TaxID=273131 RepID=A0ABR4NZ77_9SACH